MTQELPVPPEVSNNASEAHGSGVDEQPEELKIIKSDVPDNVSEAPTPLTQEHGLKRKRSCKYFLQGRCLKGEHCTFAHEEVSSKSIRSAWLTRLLTRWHRARNRANHKTHTRSRRCSKRYWSLVVLSSVYWSVSLAVAHRNPERTQCYITML